MESAPPLFPNDMDLREDPEPEQEAEEGVLSSQFIDNIISEQEEFLTSLNQAENQLMLDENFILMISSIANKKTDDFYFYDHRDSNILSMVVWADSGHREVAVRGIAEGPEAAGEHSDSLQPGPGREPPQTPPRPHEDTRLSQERSLPGQV